MSFLHAYLLGGLVLAGVPVLLHLLLRQKPKQLRFPAFRFLKARQHINRRKMQLQHLLLLLLRMLVLAGLCLALARPRLFSSQLLSASDRPVQAIFLFDTSASMEYTRGGLSRLDEARTCAKELLAEMKPESRVALVEAGEEVPEVFVSPAEARSRLELLRIRPSTGALNRSVERALRTLQQEGAEEDAPPRLLYVFSDRTRACWDSTAVKPNLPEGVKVFFVDVGVAEARDLGMDKVEIVPAVVGPGARFEVRVQVRGTPQGHENELSCVLEGEDRPPDRRPILLPKGLTSETVLFERVAPAPPPQSILDVPYQISVRLGTRDAMPFNNTRHATFLVRTGRKLLTLVDREDESRTRVWEAAHAATRSFTCDVRTFAQADKLTDRELGEYRVFALFEAANVPDHWWKRLAMQVRVGAGLAIVPGGEEVREELSTFNKQGLAAELLPAPLEQLIEAPAGKPVLWERFSRGHPLMAPFVAWTREVDPDFAREELRPFVRRYWKLGKPVEGALPITSYADRLSSPALMERSLGKGKIVLFTTPLDFRYTDATRTQQWTNFWPPSSFGLILIDRVCRYLGGEVTTPQTNFLTGEVPQLLLTSAPQPPLLVTGPGLSGAERHVPPPGADGMVRISQAVLPGNYQLIDGKNNLLGGFSVEMPARESDLERVPLAELEQALGEGCVLQVDHSVSLKEALSSTRSPPVELLPYLMMLLLLLLTLEGLLANRFYRRVPQPEGVT